MPCSRVGHVYRAMVPYDFGDLGTKAMGGEVVNTNHKRVVETWMDAEHKEHFYTRVPLARFLDHGDITEQLELRRTCKPWSWYMSTVAPLALANHPAPPPNLAWGEVRQGGLCWRPGCLQPPCAVHLSRDCEPVKGEVFRWSTSPPGTCRGGDHQLYTSSQAGGARRHREVDEAS